MCQHHATADASIHPPTVDKRVYRSTCLLAVRFTKGSWGVDCLAIYRSIQSCYIVQPNNYRTYTPHSPHENAWSDQCGDVGLG